jgi:hypothetical protein
MAEPTQRKAWRDFAAWCAARRLRALPAHPWTVSAYIRWCESRTRIQAITPILRAIARQHLLKGHASPDRHPTVRRTLRAVDIRQRAKAGQAALFRAEDFLESATDQPPATANKPRRTRGMRSTPRLVSRGPRIP